jgi:Dolichyl-phosphate-mannose-protein mannosyltransferase
MDSSSKNIRKTLWMLIIASIAIRIILALLLELTNDEPNYWLYAKFPSVSHSEHPPMVGLFVQLTTLNLRFDNEFFMRLSSLILGVFNTYMMFVIGRKIKNELTGLYAVFLFTTSVYCFVIAGVFIHPDTPLLFFYLISLYFLADGLFGTDEPKPNTSILFAGFSIGLGMLSKYTAVFLWGGVFLYAIFIERKWLKRKEIYFSALISLLCISPVLVWNALNSSNSVSFWEQNLRIFQTGLRFDMFLRELAGQVLYANPVNVFVIIAALIGTAKIQIDKNKKWFLLLTGLPLPVFFLIISLTGNTLPHWSQPGYISLILIAASYLSQLYNEKKKIIPLSVKIASVFIALILITGTLQINYGIFDSHKDENVKPTELGKHDLSLDMFGWHQASEKFSEINNRLQQTGKIGKDAPIFSNKWYNSAHIDYYIARPMNKNVFTAGNMVEIRKYDWVNRERGGYENIKEAYYISPSRDYQDPKERYGNLFSSIMPVDTIQIYRGGKPVENMFVFIMKK